MYLRRNNKTRLEVSIDEPLNVDWDGNELLLSDILGTDEDVIYKDLETEVEKRLLNEAIDKLSDRERTIINLRYGLNSPGRRRTYAKRSCRFAWNFTVIYFKIREKNNEKIKKRNGTICIMP